jgi:hypothetical protein
MTYEEDPGASLEADQSRCFVGEDKMVIYDDDIFPFIKYCFFGTSIRDIYRAIRGASLLGAFTLSVCAVDAMAHLYMPFPGKRKNRENYQKWVEDWITHKINRKCLPEVLYGLRCGLAHTSGYSDALQKCGVEMIRYTHNNPDLHWTKPEPTHYIVNLESLVAEITVGGYCFFDEFKAISAKDNKATEFIERANNLTYVNSVKSAAAQAKYFFAELDPALVSLDDRGGPKVGIIEDAIRAIYQDWPEIIGV